MCFVAVLPLAVRQNPGTTRSQSHYNKVLLLSQYRKDEPNYPVIHILPDYDPDLVMGVRMKSKDVVSIVHSSLSVNFLPETNVGIVYADIKADTEDSIFILLEAKEYENFVRFLPEMFPPEIRVTALDAETGFNLLKTAGMPSSVIMKHLEDRQTGTSFLPSYVRFLTSTPTTKKEFREKMSRPDNLLSFLASLGWTEEHVISGLACFVCGNKCSYRKCPAFSRLRCEGCHVVHYCNTHCQAGLNILALVLHLTSW